MSGELLHDRVWLSVDGGVGTLTLARAATGNALDLAMATALRDAARRLSAVDGLRVVRLEAEGRAVCVGGDLREFTGASDPTAHVAEVAAAAHDALTTLRGLPVPVISVVHGVAAGGGIGIALSPTLCSWRGARRCASPTPRRGCRRTAASPCTWPARSVPPARRCVPRQAHAPLRVSRVGDVSPRRRRARCAARA